MGGPQSTMFTEDADVVLDTGPSLRHSVAETRRDMTSVPHAVHTRLLGAFVYLPGREGDNLWDKWIWRRCDERGLHLNSDFAQRWVRLTAQRLIVVCAPCSNCGR
jgi:hypothetical protein